MLCVLVNGDPVRIAKDARTPATFDISEVVSHTAANELVAVVLRWSDASFVEDQDQWWQSGLPRSIRLLSPSVRDVEWRADATGAFTVVADGEARLLDGQGRVVAHGAEGQVTRPALWSAESP